MSTEEQFTARLRRLGEEVAAPTPVDPEALAIRAVRRVRYRRVAVPVLSAVTAVTVVAVAAVALPDAGRMPLPGESASPADASPSASASVSPAPEPTPSPTPSSSDFTYQAANVPDGWRSTGITGLALAVPEAWEDLDWGDQATWQNMEWQDGVVADASVAAMEKARADYVAEHGHEPEEPEDWMTLDSDVVLPTMWVFAGTYKAGFDVGAPVLRDVDLSVPGADVAHLTVGTDAALGALVLELTIHQPDGLWYNFHGSLPPGDEGLAMADAMAASFAFVATGPEILATLPGVDHLPVLEIARGIPAGWVEHDTHGLSYALPPEYARDTDAFGGDDPAVSDWSSTDPVAPGLAWNVNVLWSRDDYIPIQEPGPTEQRLEIEGANLATTVWSESDWGEPRAPDDQPVWPKGTLVVSGSAIVERADGAGYYSVSWTLPPGSDALIHQILGTLRIS